MNRPIVLSVVQYQDELKAGTLSIFGLLDKMEQFEGLSGVELRREVWPNYKTEVPAVQKRLAASGHLITYGTFSTLFNTDPAAHQLLLHDIQTAADLGSPLLRIFPGPAPADLNDPLWENARAAVDYAASVGVVLALENYGKNPGGKLKEVVFVLDHLPSPALMTNIDIGNYDTHGENVVQAIQTVGSRAVYAHLKDKAGGASDATTYLGGGSLPMREIVTALNALPQSLIYCFEFVGGGEADSRITKSVAYLRELNGE